MRLARNNKELRRIFGEDIGAGINEQLFAVKNRLTIESHNDFQLYNGYKNRQLVAQLRKEEKLQNAQKANSAVLNEKVKNLKQQWVQEQIDQQHLEIFQMAGPLGQLDEFADLFQEIGEKHKIPRLINKANEMKNVNKDIKNKIDVIQSGLKPPSAAISEIGSRLSTPNTSPEKSTKSRSIDPSPMKSAANTRSDVNNNLLTPLRPDIGVTNSIADKVAAGIASISISKKE